MTDAYTLPPELRVDSAADAFETMASQFKDNTPLSASLIAYFRAREDYKAREAAVEKAIFHLQTAFQDPALAENLFKKDILISASKAEVFYKCPFSYFCKFGLKLNSLNKAELECAHSGTVIHHCLEKILSENDRDTLREMPDDTLREKIQTVLGHYIAEKLG